MKRILAVVLLLCLGAAATCQFLIRPAGKSDMPAYETAQITWTLFSGHYTIGKKGTMVETLVRTCYFTDAQGQPIRSFYASGNGWAAGVIPMGGDEITTPIPKTLHMQYYDYQEDRFYQLKAELPMEKIYKLFQQKMVDFDRHLGQIVPRYNKIKVGIAPQGYVMVWAGSDMDQVELGQYWASHQPQMTAQRYNQESKPPIPINPDRWEALSDYGTFRTVLDQETFEKLKGGWLPDNQYYRQQRVKYPWRYRLSGNGRLVDLSESRGNVEAEYIAPWQMERYKTAAVMRGVPTSVLMWFIDGKGKWYYLPLYFFDETKTGGADDSDGLATVWAAFEKLFPGRKPEDNDYAPGEQDMATLDIHISDDLKTWTATLIKGDQKIPLPIFHTRLVEIEPYAHWPKVETPPEDVIKLLMNGPGDEASRAIQF